MKEAQLLIGSSADNDIFYATRFDAPDQFYLLIIDGRKIMLVSDLEYGRAQRTATVDEVLCLSDLKKDPKASVLLTFLGRYGVESVTVPQSFPVAIADFLRRSRISCCLKGESSYSAEEPFFPERAIKTLEEIQHIQEVQRIIEEVFLIAREEIAQARVGSDNTLLRRSGEMLTAEFLRTLMNVEFKRRNCDSGNDLIIACGKQACDPHEKGTGPLYAHAWIVFDIYPRHSGTHFFSDMTRTIAKGSPPQDAVALYEAVRKEQEFGVSQVRAGVDGYDIHSAIREHFDKRGYQTGKFGGVMQGFFHGTGHGVGLAIHEAPRIGNVRNQILRVDHVVTVEPGLYYPDTGGVRIEDTVVVKKGGCENLTTLPKDLNWAVI